MKKFSVAQVGWVTDALAAIYAGEAVEISVHAEDAKKIVLTMTEVTNKLPILDIFSAVTRIVPVAGAIPVSPKMVMPILTSIGGLGGACGATAFVASVAVAHGYKTAFTYDMGALFDPTDDRLVITLTP